MEGWQHLKLSLTNRSIGLISGQTESAARSGKPVQGSNSKPRSLERKQGVDGKRRFDYTTGHLHERAKQKSALQKATPTGVARCRFAGGTAPAWSVGLVPA